MPRERNNAASLISPRRFDCLCLGGLAHQLQQIRNVNCDAPRLSFSGQLGGQSAGELVLEIDLGELLPVVIAHGQRNGSSSTDKAVPTAPLTCTQPIPESKSKTHIAPPGCSSFALQCGCRCGRQDSVGAQRLGAFPFDVEPKQSNHCLISMASPNQGAPEQRSLDRSPKNETRRSSSKPRGSSID
jgi:hypothetical protein